jgi:signal transduction histidine kinase
LAVDVAVCSGLLALSGTSVSPFYLYSLSPLFGSGLFFQIRGGLLAATGMGLVYTASAVGTSILIESFRDLPLMAIHIAGFFLIASLFANFASLLDKEHSHALILSQIGGELEKKTLALERSNRDLRSLHALAMALQSSAVDVHDVQRRVLTIFTRELGYPRAIMGLIDHGDFALTAWMEDSRDTASGRTVPVTLKIPIGPNGGLLTQALTERSYHVVSGNDSPDDWPLKALQLGRGVVLPLLVHEVPVGVLAVEVEPDYRPDEEAIALLNCVAHQASLAIWSTRMCIERAHRSAILEERSRIARDIHDSVLQSLFGITYIVESCLKLVSDEEQAIRDHLEVLLRQSRNTMAEIRHLVFDMWIGGMTTGEFVAELQSYLDDIGRPPGLTVTVSVEGDITELSPFTRKHLFRIAQEALANVVRHARATRATVHLSADSQFVRLTVEDNGIGFDTTAAQEGIGLSGMHERAQAIGAALEIQSNSSGTTVELRLPRLACIARPQLGS